MVKDIALIQSVHLSNKIFFLWDIYIWSGKYNEEGIPIITISGNSVAECMKKFLSAPLGDGKSLSGVNRNKARVLVKS